MQRSEKPRFRFVRILELMPFVRPNVKRFLSQIGGLGFARRKAEAESIKIAVIKLH